MRQTLFVLVVLTAGCTQFATDSPSSPIPKDTEMVLFSKLEDKTITVHDRPGLASTWEDVPVGTKVRVVNDSYEEGPSRWIKVTVLEGKNKNLVGFVTRHNLK